MCRVDVGQSASLTGRQPAETEVRAADVLQMEISMTCIMLLPSA